MAEPQLLLKIGEAFLKGRNRPRFLDALIAATRRAVGPEPHIRHLGGKIGVQGAGHDPSAIDRLAHVFGITSIEIAWRVDPDLDAIRRAAVVVAGDEVRSSAGAIRTFRVSARRSWKGFPVRSVDLNRDVGAAVADATGLAVRLGAPDLDVRIEVGTPHSFIFVRRVAGAGGLPPGCSGRAMLLLSGGIDSPVAGWLAMRRGLALEIVHFHSPPHTGPAALRKVRDLGRELARWQGMVRVSFLRFTSAQEAVRDGIDEEYRVLIYRRIMMRVASRLAGRAGAQAIVTGESLAQVASQTLENMACVEAASALPVIRPLVTYDKREVIEQARRLGTYDISIRPGEDCCSLFVPRHPVTRGRENACRRNEARLDLDAIVEECLGSAESERIEEPTS